MERDDGYDSGGLVETETCSKGNKNYLYLAELQGVYPERSRRDKFGQRVFMELGNGVRTNYTYRADNRRLDNLRSQLPNPNQYVFQNIS
ncbi:MAG: hypothetical protein ACOY5B_07415 [Spirochaetota bacterium]